MRTTFIVHPVHEIPRFDLVKRTHIERNLWRWGGYVVYAMNFVCVLFVWSLYMDFVCGLYIYFEWSLFLSSKEDKHASNITVIVIVFVKNDYPHRLYFSIYFLIFFIFIWCIFLTIAIIIVIFYFCISIFYYRYYCYYYYYQYYHYYNYGCYCYYY